MTPALDADAKPSPHVWVRAGNAGTSCRVCGWGPQAAHHRLGRLLARARPPAVRTIAPPGSSGR